MEWIFASVVLAMMIFVPAFRYIVIISVVLGFVLISLVDENNYARERVERTAKHDAMCLDPNDPYSDIEGDCRQVRIKAGLRVR